MSDQTGSNSSASNSSASNSSGSNPSGSNASGKTFVPRASSLADRDYIAFTTDLRSFALGDLEDVVRDNVEEILAEKPATEVADLRRRLDPVPIVALRNRIRRSQQEMTWRRVRETLYQRETELLAALDEAESRTPGSVTWDPDFQYPDYYVETDIHLQPDNYHGDPLAGYIYHYGTNTFYMGRNDDDSIKRTSISKVPVPKDGVVNNILDLATSIGQSATALKERFPDARVAGIDLAAPMVRYAHLRAVELGVDVEFRQESADALTEPDGTVDLVHVNILFHEVPRSVAERVVQEAHRVLRDGGLFVISDFVNRRTGVPLDLADYHRDIDSVFNGEPFASPFVYSDFESLLRQHFSEVDPAFEIARGGVVGTRVCTK